MTEQVVDTHIRIAESLHKEMQRLAREHGRTLSKEMEQAFKVYIEDNSRPSASHTPHITKAPEWNPEKQEWEAMQRVREESHLPFGGV